MFFILYLAFHGGVFLFPKCRYLGNGLAWISQEEENESEGVDEFCRTAVTVAHVYVNVNALVLMRYRFYSNG